MKYTSKELNDMSYLEWMETIAKELNDAGFKGDGYDPILKRFARTSPYAVHNISTFFMGAINDAKAMDYLKSIGLVNNGRCPMCGTPIKGTPSNFTDGFNPNLNFHICSSCRREGQRISGKGSGCIIALFLIPWNVIKSIISI